MKKIGIISDLHGTFDSKLRDFLNDVDEIWCAGDIGSEAVAQEIASFKPFRAVYGNVDNYELRYTYPEFLSFRIEEVEVLMTHIGMLYGKYCRAAYSQIMARKPQLFISGHSHILKIFFDKKSDLLNINPGAAGCYGFHRIRTAVRFEIDGRNMCNLEVAEWPR